MNIESIVNLCQLSKVLLFLFFFASFEFQRNVLSAVREERVIDIVKVYEIYEHLSSIWIVEMVLWRIAGKSVKKLKIFLNLWKNSWKLLKMLNDLKIVKHLFEMLQTSLKFFKNHSKFKTVVRNLIKYSKYCENRSNVFENCLNLIKKCLKYGKIS